MRPYISPISPLCLPYISPISPQVLADRMEDVTPPAVIERNPQALTLTLTLPLTMKSKWMRSLMPSDLSISTTWGEI